jgi:hypothetical protein
MTPDEIEASLTKHAATLGVSAAKLRAIYMRGVNDCLEQGHPGLPSTYGMARVQRFMIAAQTGNHRVTPDSDFIAQAPSEPEDARTYEISEAVTSSWPLIFDTLSLDGSALSSRFPAESVEGISYDEDSTELSVSGTYDSVQWFCTLNLTTGEHTFVTNVD